MEMEQCLMHPLKKVQVTTSSARKKPCIRMDGPDGGWAWGVALSACLINFIMAGLGRMSGILYVAFIEIFDVNRKSATAPFSIRSSVRNLLGPVVGILGQQYGVRAVTLAGGVIGCLSAASGFFATDMLWITILWGGINGIGTALTTTLPQVVIGQYFKKYRTTAAGMAFSGGCVGAFMFPVLLEHLLQIYGLPGTFLIMGGIIMHVIPAAMILKKPPWHKKRNKNTRSGVPISIQVVSNVDAGPIEELEYPAMNCNEKCTNEGSTITDKVNGFADDVRNDVAEPLGRQMYNLNNDKVLYEENDSVSNWFQRDQTFVLEIMLAAIQNYKTDCDTTIENTERICIRDTMQNANFQIDNNVVLKLLSDIYAKAEQVKRIQKLKLCDEDSDLEKNGGVCKIPLEGQQLERVQKNEEKLAEPYEMCKLVILQTLQEINREPQLKNYISRYQNNEQFQKNNDKTEQVLQELCKVYELYEQRFQCQQNGKNKLIPSEMGAVSNGNPNLEEEMYESEEKEGFIEHIKTAIKLNLNPIFHLICLCRAVHFITFIPTVTVIVDFGMDKGLLEEDGKYIIAALSCGDLLGRLCLGWVTDRKLLSLPKYMLFVMVIQGASTAALPLVYTKSTLLPLVGLFGLLQGSVFIRHPILVSKYMANHEQSIAMGCINFLSGFLGFGLPHYIGYFRDTLGSYDQMFYITGALGSFVGLIWIFEPYLAKFASPDGHWDDDDDVEDSGERQRS